jgi:DNA-binding NarL/FixJ family response regulator
MQEELPIIASVGIASPLPDAVFLAQEQLQRILEELRGEFQRLSAMGGRNAVPADAVARESHAGMKSLSPREKQVWVAIAKGQSTKAIAYQLGLSYKTITGYRTSLMKKLNLHSVADLTRLAIQENIFSS